MSINITDKVGDNVETLVDNTNEAIVTVNNQLDSSVLANLTTEVKDTLVNAINEINQKKFNKTDNYIPNDLSIGGKLIADQVVLSIDEDNNSSVYFYDTTNKAHIKLFWNNNLRKWQLSFPDGKIVDIANSDDLNNIQIQIDEAIASINYDFNTNVKPLIFKQLPANEINEYTGSAGEIVLNSSDWSEIRVHDGVTKGGVIVSGGSTVINWEPNKEIKKDQCVYYGNGLYRSKSKHTTGNNFDIDLYDVLASYKKIVEKQTTSEETDTITLHQAITDKKELDINIGGLIIQQDGYSIIDSYHIKLSEAIPANADVEVTYYKASNLLNSSIIINKYTVQNDGEKTIPLDNIVENHTLILQVNVENTVLLNDEWQLGENNSSIVLKNGLKSGDRVQIMFLKGVQVAQNGITFTPKVVNGVLTWSNDGGLDNPENISIVTTDTVQTINAKKTFNNIEVITKDVNDSSKAAANTEWVQKNSNLIKTNCITEIPQDIKLELADGVLTLKAGSKVYVPNSFEADGVTPKFDVVVIESDLTSSVTSNEIKTFFIVYNFTTGKIMTNWVSSCSSGATVPSGFEYGFLYNTADNTIFNYTDVKTNNQVSFPLAIFTASSSGITSINQVFNGFGYIGSTVFALPGVKGLIPNGRNADGSLKNIEFTVDKVLTKTYSSTLTTNPDGMHYIDADGIQSTVYGAYNDKDNYNYNANTSEKINRCYFCQLSVTAGRIGDFRTKEAFNVVDRSDSSWIAQQAMPSNRYIDLTLGASGATYTAPANGYAYLIKTSTASGQYINIYNGSGVSYNTRSPASGKDNIVLAQVLKGKNFKIEYDMAGETKYFRFIYAVGEK